MSLCTCNAQRLPHDLMHNVCPHDQRACWTCNPPSPADYGEDDPSVQHEGTYELGGEG